MQIINTEWGAFSRGLPLTVFDRDMDAATINPGEQVSSGFCHQCQFTFVDSNYRSYQLWIICHQ